jgi:O-glycosyl hydrolase
VNEPYPGMFWDAEDLNTFTNSYLVPALAQAGLQPQMLAADDVCFDSQIPYGQLSNTVTDDNTSAVSLHGYCGSYGAVSTVHYTYPYKPVYQTEIATDCPTRGANTTGPAAVPAPSPDLDVNNLDTFPDFLISLPRNWASLVTAWN